MEGLMGGEVGEWKGWWVGRLMGGEVDGWEG